MVVLVSEGVVLRWGLFKREHCLKARSLCIWIEFFEESVFVGEGGDLC